jgi:hypothetical protein
MRADEEVPPVPPKVAAMKRLLLLLLTLLLLAGCGGPDHYLASSKSEPFHKPSCASAERITTEHLQTYKTRDEAIAAGHRPCQNCKP